MEMCFNTVGQYGGEAMNLHYVTNQWSESNKIYEDQLTFN